MSKKGLGTQYHSYRIFGEDNPQKEKFRLNQLCKEKIILSYILYSIAQCGGTPSFVELFCADGYYAMAAKRFGCGNCSGIDNGHRKYFSKAKKIAESLNIDVNFINMEVDNINTLPQYDIVANIGGLYHVKNPDSIIKKSYTLAKKFLIVQSVVPQQFGGIEVSPKDRPWGSRFGEEYIDSLLFKYNVIDRYFTKLSGNKEPKNGYSVSYLIKKGNT